MTAADRFRAEAAKRILLTDGAPGATRMLTVTIGSRSAADCMAPRAEGAACEVTFGDRTLPGTCGLDRSQRLFCRPTNMPPAPPREG